MTTPGRQPISAAQQELLSAYLDNQLGGVERAALERNLAADAALRAELEELRTVRQLLRGLPTLTPPRSFTIAPAQARSRRLPLFGWLRVSSALAALLLMLTFLPGLLTGGGVVAPSVAVAPTLVSADASADTAQERASEAGATTAPAAAAAPPAALKATTGSALVPAPTVAAAASMAAGSTVAPAADTGAAASSYAATPEIELPAPLESTRTALTTDAGTIGASGSASPDTQQIDPQQPVPGQPLPPLRWAQLALAALAVALGIGALLARRAGR